MKEPLACKPNDFEKLVHPRTQLLIGAVWVVLITYHWKHQSNQNRNQNRFRASQIWSHLIFGRRLQMLWTDIYLNRVCAKVYEIRVFKL